MNLTFYGFFMVWGKAMKHSPENTKQPVIKIRKIYTLYSLLPLTETAAFKSFLLGETISF